MKRAVLIVNPMASKVDEERIATVERTLMRAAYLRTVRTERPRHAVQLAADAADAEAIVVFSGDGGFNEVLNGLERPDLPVGFVPGGGTSVLPRALGLPRDPVEAAEQIADALRENRTRRISTGRANGRRFAFSAGIGLDAEAVRRVDERGRSEEGKRPGDLAFVGTFARMLLAQRGRFDPVLEIDGYGRAALVLRGLSVSVPAGTVVCLVGPNGAGKSTVLKVASGLLAPRSGSVRVDGEDVTGLSPQRMLAAGVAHVLQGHSVFPEMTVAENVTLGAYTVTDKARVAERVAFVQDLFPVVRERWRSLAGLLSGGQQKQVEFARSLMVSPKVLLLDEPSMGLDPKATAIVFEQVVAMREAGLAILLVEQNARRALETADIGCVLDLGRVHISGPAPKLLADPQLAELYLGGRPTVSQKAGSTHAHRHERRDREDGLPPAPRAVHPRDP